MSIIVNVLANGLELLDSTKYGVTTDTLYMLEQLTPREAVMVDMQYRAPVFVRTQYRALPFTMGIMLREPSAEQRETDWLALLTAIDVPDSLFTLQWIRANATSRSLKIAVNTALASLWFSRGSLECVAPAP